MEPASRPPIRIMPAGFGPAGGPRQVPDHPDFRDGPLTYGRYIVRFLGRAEQLSKLLPPGVALRGEPIVNLHFLQLTAIPWLAGRGYNLMTMLLPVRHTASNGQHTDGQFQAVLWENLGDPIITGREQLGHPKLYAQLPKPRRWNGATHLRASWEGFTFAEMELRCDATPDSDFVGAFVDAVGTGVISHKYIPRSGAWDQADADYLTLSPVPGASNLANPQPQPSMKVGSGRVTFNAPTWQDMPTQYHIIRQLAELEQVEPREAIIMEGTMYIDFSDVRILA